MSRLELDLPKGIPQELQLPLWHSGVRLGSAQELQILSSVYVEIKSSLDASTS